MTKDKENQNQPLPLIGRFGTSLKIGILGLPNVGKSTLFNVLTKSQVAAENYPFCTINPNEARVPVPDSRFDKLCEIYKPISKVPAFLTVLDIAGLVKGASTGQGLGNAFLSNLSACDAIFHVVRCFADDSVVHVEGNVDPARDLEIISDELRLKDIEFINKRIEGMEKTVNRGSTTNPELKKQKEEFDILCKLRDILQKDAKHLRLFKTDWTEKEIDILNKHLFLTAKPVIYLLNMSSSDYTQKKTTKNVAKAVKWIKSNDTPTAIIIPFSAQFEAQYFETHSSQDVENGLKSLQLNSSTASSQNETPVETESVTSVLPKIIVTGFRALHLQYFFTAGPDEVKAWVVSEGTKAPSAAGKIHTAMEKGFIMAEVMSYHDFISHQGSELAVKAAGKYRQQGRNYVVQDGDIIYFKFNAGAGLTASKDKK